MGIAGGAGVVFFGYLLWRSRKEVLPEEWHLKRYLKALYRCAAYLYRKMGYPGDREGGLGHVREDMAVLHPAGDMELFRYQYYLDKISLCIAAAVIGTGFAFILWLKSVLCPVLIDGYGILRNPHGRGSLEAVLMVEPAATGESTIKGRELQIEIPEQRYTEKELEIYYKKFCAEAGEVLTGSHKSNRYVTENLYLPDSLEPYPFQISWESSDEMLIDGNGNLGKKIAEQGEEVRLTAKLSCQDWEKEYSFLAVVFPTPANAETLWEESLKKEVDKYQKETEHEKMLKLPAQVEGIPISWKAKRDTTGYLVLVLTAAGIVVIYIGKDRDLHREREKRNQKMLLDYPEIVQKLTLFMGAGMTVRTAWQKMTLDYVKSLEKNKEKNYAYEEMLVAWREMESGISEAKSYHNFAKRCRIPCYLKLGALLSQNLRKGSVGLLQILRNEADLAFEERKRMARKLGEEAGTKLLLPMMLMLGVVMVVVMVPAFLSFSI